MSEPLEYSLTIYPDPVLRSEAEPVTDFGEELERFVEAMFATMEKSEGVGLAAPQVGRKLRVLVLNATGKPEDKIVLVNPRIVERSGPTSLFDEGCLSFPGIYAEIRRPERCRVEAVDLRGTPFTAEYAGFVSRIVQHEYDHLEGVLLVDRMSPADKMRNKSALDRLVERYRAGRKSPSPTR